MKLRFFFSAHRLIVVYISTKFHENIQDGIKVIQYFTFLSKQLITLINTHINYTLSVPTLELKLWNMIDCIERTRFSSEKN